jgi:hypothetical protein
MTWHATRGVLVAADLAGALVAAPQAEAGRDGDVD